MADKKLIKAIFKGALTFIPGVNFVLEKKKKKSRHSGSDALFSYSLWLSNLVYLAENKIQPNNSRLAEIGNGGSLGIAFCAILTGTNKYFSFEYKHNIDYKEQIQLLERISVLFDKAEPIHHFNNISITISDSSFPQHLVLPKLEREVLLEQLKGDLQNELVGSDLIILVNNWETQNPLNITFAFSRAVMEHVNDPDYIYQKIFSHMSAHAMMLHDIEFHSHGITDKINGHYKIPNFLWSIIFGKRPFFLNRLNASDHSKCIKEIGFKVILEQEKIIEDPSRLEKVINSGVIISEKSHV